MGRVTIHVIYALATMVVVSHVAVAQCRPLAYVPSGDGIVTIIDTSTGTVLLTVPVGSDPGGTAIHPDGTFAYVANQLDGTVSVIETITSTVEATVSVGTLPLGITVLPNGKEVWVANAGTDTISVIDTSTNTVTATIPGGVDPRLVAVHPDGSSVYVANIFGNDIWVIDTATKTVTNTIAVGSAPAGIRFLHDGSRAFVANIDSDDIHVIDTATESVTDVIAVGDGPQMVACALDDATIYVTNFFDDTVSVINVASKLVTNTIAVGSGPLGAMVHPGGDELYIVNSGSDTVSVIDLGTELVINTIAVGITPTGIGDFISDTGVTPPTQAVFLDFGTIGVPVDKTDKDIFNEDGDVLMTLEKGPRAGFDPVDIGYAGSADRDLILRQITRQVAADFETLGDDDLDICFTTSAPTSLTYTTVKILAGLYPDMRVAITTPGNILVAEVATARVVTTGSAANNYEVKTETGTLRRADGSEVESVTFPDFKRIKLAAFGSAQQLDKGNLDKNKTAWVFVGHHIESPDPDENRRELANSISHELGHLLGIEHNDGVGDSIVGDLVTYGTDKGFSPGTMSKLATIMPPGERQRGQKRGVGLRVRTAKIGNSDQFGTSEPGTLTGVPDEDAEAIMREARRLLASHVAHEARIEYDLIDMQQLDPEDGVFTDTELPNGTMALYSLDLGVPGLDASLVRASIEIAILNVADVLGGPDDCRLFVDGLELHGAFDGLDQRIADPEFAGYAFGETVTFALENYFSTGQIATMLADGFLDVLLEVHGDTPFVGVDSVLAVVVDGADSGVGECAAGTVNLAAGLRADVLFLNGTAGGPLRRLAVDADDLIWASLLRPPTGGNGKFVVHMNTGAPTTATVAPLPASIGSACFKMLLSGGAAPISIWNNIGRASLVGSSNYFGVPISDPNPAPTVLFQFSAGDLQNLPPGTTTTMQGVIIDLGTLSGKGVSTTNALVLEVL